jgi:hypothetical protein
MINSLFKPSNFNNYLSINLKVESIKPCLLFVFLVFKNIIEKIKNFLFIFI